MGGFGNNPIMWQYYDIWNLYLNITKQYCIINVLKGFKFGLVWEETKL